ncbi:cysteine--tRNA ligase [Methylocella sp.]|uniref:cysteine--tRNA ligase n=1 Tax=Methylocella sp. TaxID=1978226 RepID=UPI003784F5EB
MPELRLHNFVTKRRETLVPIEPGHVRIYCCGPTVYDLAHIGNARPAVIYDVLTRVLRLLFPRVTYVRNVTDIDDKINNRAREQGVPIGEITERTLADYRADIAALGNLPPDVEPRATETIAEIIVLIERLIASGHAYAAEGHVLFSVPSFSQYGAFSGRSPDELLAGARVDVAPYKRDAGDFVLWKPSTPDLPGWDSPWGRGRPGWHIECSAMSWRHLGENFDIHGGGTDLIFPHHENEIAQSLCAFPGSRFARMWVHNGMLVINGEKMSKSLGNFVTIHELLTTDAFGGRPWPGAVLRLAMLRTHYRQPIDFTVKSLEEAERALLDWRKAAEGVAPGAPGENVVAALADDLNTPRAISELHVLKAKDPAALLGGLSLLGIDLASLPQETRAVEASVFEKAMALVAEREAARRAKNWAESDRLRAALAAMGVALRDDRGGGTTWEFRP